MNEQIIIDSIEHFARTGEIQDTLVPYFQQSGRWFGDCRNWSKPTYRMASSIMHQAVLPEWRRTMENDRGESILLTSFTWKKRRDVELPWHKVSGSIKIRSLEWIYAPHLKTVGGYFYSPTDSRVCLPNLQRVGGDFDFQGTQMLHVPALTEVGGSLMVVECDLPNLEIVGNRFSGFWSGYLHLPHLLQVGGSLEIEGPERFSAPSLRWVCYDLCLSHFTTVFCANKLEEVGGSLNAGSAKIFHAAKLRHVGDTLNSESAADYYRPEFENLALWEVHPDARRRWQMRMAVRNIMRDLPPMDI